MTETRHPARRVGTANVKFTIPTSKVGGVLAAQMADTDTTVLNEWNGNDREALLAATGRLLRPLSTALRLPLVRRPRKGWVWAQSAGVAVGMDASRFAVRRTRRVALHTQRTVKRKFASTHLGHRFAVIMFATDRLTGEKVAVIGFHLPAGVEGRHGYQTSDPARVDAHKDARRTLERTAAQLIRRGWTVYAAGDTNYDDLVLDGLVSCWGRNGPGTHGGPRTLDIVYGQEPADDAEKFADISDHDRVVATYGDDGAEEHAEPWRP